MSDNAHGLVQWAAYARLVNATNAQLDEWKSWGIDGLAFQMQRPSSLVNGAQKFSGNPADVHATSAEWAAQRELVSTDIMARCAARGIKTYFVFYCSNYQYSASYRGFWKNYFDDAAWALVLDDHAKIAGACELFGMAGVIFDMEDYQQFQNGAPNTNAARPTWSWDAFSGQPHTQAAVRAQVKLRGAEMATAICDAYPTIQLGAYFLRLPRGSQTWAEANSNGLSYLTINDSYVQIDWLSGLFSTGQVQSFRQCIEPFYKQGATTQFGGGRTPGDTRMKIDLGPARAHMSRYAGFDWDYTASRLHHSFFTWIDPSNSPGERDNGFDFKGIPFVTSQFEQASLYSTGGEFHNYAHKFSSVPTGWDYDDPAHNVVPAMQAASVAATVDASNPTISLVSSEQVSADQVISGSAYDDFFILRVSWVNNSTAATGEAEMTFVDLSGRPMQPRHSGITTTLGAFELPTGTPTYLTWRMDWTATVPLVGGSDSLTITAHDIHGRTATVNATGGVTITPDTEPIVVANAASGTSQTSTTLSGTVNPNGLSSTARFEYGTTVSYGSLTTELAMGSGSVPAPISQVLNGLTAGTTYHFRLTSTSSAGTNVTADQTFATPAAASAVPVVALEIASSVTQTTVTLDGTVNPNGLATDARFEYGTTTDYGQQTPIVAMGSGAVTVPISQGVTGLTAGTLYHYRLTATNGQGTSTTTDGTFTTTTLVSGPSYVEAVIAESNLANFWLLGEASGTVAEDAIGASVGTYVNTPTLGAAGLLAGMADTAVTFTAAQSEHVYFSSNVPLRPGTGPFSLEFMIYRAGNPAGSEFVFTCGDPASGGHTIHLLSSGLVRPSIGATAWSSTVGVCDSAPHHVVVSCPRTGLFTIYIDGVECGTAAAHATNLNGGGAADAYFARRQVGTYLSATLQVFGYYTDALTAEEALEHATAAGVVEAPPVPARVRSLDFASDTAVVLVAPRKTAVFTNQVLTAVITPHVLRGFDG